MELFDKLYKVFEKEGQLDIKGEKWQRFKVDHFDNDRNALSDLFKKKIGKKKKGLYAYYLGRKFLYIGKANCIKGRLMCHYDESQNHPGKNKKWNEFFSQQKGKLTVYWLELDADERNKGEILRMTLESILTLKYRPRFIDFKSSSPDILLDRRGRLR